MESRSRLVSLLVVSGLLASGCVSIGPDFETPASEVNPQWLAAEDDRVRTDPAQTLAWWKGFQDPVLESVIQQAYEQNPTLQIAGLRVFEARAILGVAVGSLYPQVQQAGATAGTLELSENAEPVSNLPGFVRSGVDTRFSNYRLGFDAAWELDFWGRFRRTVESADAHLAATIASYDDVLVTLASTIGDELVLSNGGRSRVFSVSGKDRGAILPGGHAGKAFWYSKSSGHFVTSSYYYDAYPGWVEAWNGASPAEAFRGTSWELSKDPSGYLAAGHDDRPFEAAAVGLGRTFPHAYGDDKYLTLKVGLTPAVDTLTLDFSRTLIREEKLGQGTATDFLAVSFSATDYAGHLFGPSSMESEDTILRLDRHLAELFRTVDEAVGLENALIVLSADHGGPEAPEAASEVGIETGRFPFDAFKVSDSPLHRAARERFGRGDLIADHSHPYLYLNEAAIRNAGLEVAEVERFLAREAMKIPGIFYALAGSDIREGRLTHAPLQERIRRSFSPLRSGNIHLVPQPYWFLHSTDEADKMGLPGLAAIHGSPWAYDTYVPIFFAGGRLARQTVSRRVAPTDIAATIAAYLDIKAPSGSVGTPLHEVLQTPR